MALYGYNHLSHCAPLSNFEPLIRLPKTANQWWLVGRELPLRINWTRQLSFIIIAIYVNEPMIDDDCATACLAKSTWPGYYYVMVPSLSS